MEELLTIEQYCMYRFRDRLVNGKPKKAQLNSVSQMCRDGKFKRAFKIGKLWFIDISAEMEASGD